MALVGNSGVLIQYMLWLTLVVLKIVGVMNSLLCMCFYMRILQNKQLMLHRYELFRQHLYGTFFFDKHICMELELRHHKQLGLQWMIIGIP